MARKGGEKLYQFVDALVATSVREIISGGLTADEKKAREVAREIAHAICGQYARTILYVPADLERQLTQRDEVIWAKYGQDGPDGARKYSPTRVAQLAEEYKLTVAHVYQIVRLMHKREMAGRQGVLPGLEEPGNEPSEAPQTR